MKRASLFPLLSLVAVLGAHGSALAAPPTAADVGDADSFGRKAVWVGYAQTAVVTLVSQSSDCPTDGGPNDQCVTLVAGPNNFNYVDLGRITLPGNSVNSFLCQSVTPTIGYTLSNTSNAAQNARFVARATFRIESEVLSAPIDTAIPLAFDLQTLAPGAVRGNRVLGTRACQGGLVTKAGLIDSGLTEQQAKKFFEKPITIRVGMSGVAVGVSDASLIIGTRFTGDDK